MTFFGVVVKFEEAVSVCFDASDLNSRLHISQAVLGEPRVNCILEGRNVLFCQVGETSPIAIASLRHKKSEMVNLKLHFERPVKIKFSVQGTRDIYVSGFYYAQAPHTIMPPIFGTAIREEVSHALKAPPMQQVIESTPNQDIKIGGVEKEAQQSVADVEENIIASGGEKLAFESSGMQNAHVEQSGACVQEIVDKSGVVGINKQFEDVAEKNPEPISNDESIGNVEEVSEEVAEMMDTGVDMIRVDGHNDVENHEVDDATNIIKFVVSEINEGIEAEALRDYSVSEELPKMRSEKKNVSRGLTRVEGDEPEIAEEITKQEMKKKKTKRKELPYSKDGDDDELRFVLCVRPETSTKVVEETTLSSDMGVETPIVADLREISKPQNDSETVIENMRKPKRKKKRTEMTADENQQVVEETQLTSPNIVAGLCAIPKSKCDSVNVANVDKKSKPKHVDSEEGKNKAKVVVQDFAIDHQETNTEEDARLKRKRRTKLKIKEKHTDEQSDDTNIAKR